MNVACTDALGYGQLYCNTPLDSCLSRNSLRHGDQRIDEEVIVGMKERLEPPDGDVNAWEKHSIELQPGYSSSLSRYVHYIAGMEASEWFPYLAILVRRIVERILFFSNKILCIIYDNIMILYSISVVINSII